MKPADSLPCLGSFETVIRAAGTRRRLPHGGMNA